MLKLTTAALAAISLLAGAALGQSRIALSIDSHAPGLTIPDDFCGLSYELKGVNPDEKGVQYFRPDNLPLIQMFKTLGIKSLRIGGNTADRASVRFPKEQDLDSLFAFARAANVKVIFTMRLVKDGDPAGAATLAKYIMDHYGAQMNCFAIGNEPNAINSFTSDYKVYLEAFRKYSDAILTVAPGARFCGPSATGAATGWTRDFAGDFPPQSRVDFVTYHYYPGGNAARIVDPAEGRRKLLAPEILQAYAKLADGFVPAVLAKGARYRLEEVNSIYNGGRLDASDTQAAALWSLEFMYFWAGRQCSGLNFHTGDYVAREAENTKCNYAAFWSTDAGYDAHPLAYGIKAFDLAGHGTLIPVKIETNDQKLNASAYATLQSDGNVAVTLLNKGAEAADISIAITGKYSRCEVMALTAPANDSAAKTGITLGGAAIGEDGNWSGNWTSQKPRGDGTFAPHVGPFSAAVVRLHPE